MQKAKHIPVRGCVTCGERLPKRQLIRIVRTPAGKVLVDPTGKIAGRGAYLCPKEECWSRGLRKARLEHVLRAPLPEQDREALSLFYHEHLKSASIGDVR